MKLKKVNRDPFSNGSEHLMFECKCCDNCIKYSYRKRKGMVNESNCYCKRYSVL